MRPLGPPSPWQGLNGSCWPGQASHRSGQELFFVASCFCILFFWVFVLLLAWAGKLLLCVRIVFIRQVLGDIFNEWINTLYWGGRTMDSATQILTFASYQVQSRQVSCEIQPARHNHHPTHNRALNKPAWPGPNWPKMPILGQIWSFWGKKS